MNKAQHQLLSFSISLYIFYFLFDLSLDEVAIYSLIVGFISTLPDIDLKIIRFFSRIPIWLRASLYLIELLVKGIIKHRGITHNVWVYLIFICLWYYYDMFLFLVIWIGLMLHVIEDAMTVRGVKCFKPYNFKLKIWNFKTNNSLDSIVIDLISIILIFYFMLILL